MLKSHGMANVGPLELGVVLIIVLVVFGPKRLPELGRSLGDGIREFKSSLSGEDGDGPAEEPRELHSGAPAKAVQGEALTPQVTPKRQP